METYQIICLVLGIVIFWTMVLYKLRHDVAERKKGIYINHWSEALRILVPFGTVTLTFFTIAAPFHWYTIPLVAVMIMGSHWFFFDGLYSLSQFKGWFGTGSEDGKHDAKTDNILQAMPKWLQITVKIIFLVVPIGVYMLTLWHGK